MRAGYKVSVLVFVICLTFLDGYGQPGIYELQQASGQLRQSFFSAHDACLVLAGILGICGAVSVYHNWQMGEHRITGKVAAWFFAAFFMVLLGPFLQVLFGI